MGLFGSILALSSINGAQSPGAVVVVVVVVVVMVVVTVVVVVTAAVVFAVVSVVDIVRTALRKIRLTVLHGVAIGISFSPIPLPAVPPGMPGQLR